MERPARYALVGRRSAAVVAAGAVLGVGTMTTLASWTGDEFTTGSFGASEFVVESETRLDVYASHASAPGATLDFGPQPLVQGVSAFAWINMRTTAQTTASGILRLTSQDAEGDLPASMEYRAVRTGLPMTDATCASPVFVDFNSVYIAGGPSQWLPVNDNPPAPAAVPIGPALDDIGFCFEVRLVAAAGPEVAGQTGTVTWGFTAVSNS